MSLTRDQILAADDIRFVDVAVPEWGGNVRVKLMNGVERNHFETLLRGRQGEDIRSAIVAATVVGDDGQPLFTLADADALGKKSWRALERVANAAAELNKLTDAAVEATAKN